MAEHTGPSSAASDAACRPSRWLVRVSLESAAALALFTAAGTALQHLADAPDSWLRAVPIGPVSATATGSSSSAPPPQGEHGWVPLPLGLLDVLLLWGAAPAWRQTSYWHQLRGPLKGQASALITCVFSVLPALLSAWLLWMPWRCTPLTTLLALSAATLALAAAAFWADALPLLPRANVDDASARAAVRRSLLYLLQVASFVGRVGATAEGPTAALQLMAQLRDTPVDVFNLLVGEAEAQTPQVEKRARFSHMWAPAVTLCFSHMSADEFFLTGSSSTEKKRAVSPICGARPSLCVFPTCQRIHSFFDRGI